VSPFCQRSRRVSDINLTERRRKVDRLLLPSTEPVLILADADASHFSTSKTVDFTRIFNLCLRFEFLT
jgi:hypothetical protein